MEEKVIWCQEVPSFKDVYFIFFWLSISKILKLYTSSVLTPYFRRNIVHPENITVSFA